ncbi:PASTA domain-containing protein [Thermomonospora echinospora]|uniref:PASTA domain-containing protein n=1 Tax=Thermomonospora echinospora TaxID=1992 RepID=A0A1H6D739_9ACTN|nr:PASTA domain-containing protein [Thermomonospora echinospora]SEG80798.1 PASTA domain-containing protein [Thermomonospora echinospora]
MRRRSYLPALTLAVLASACQSAGDAEAKPAATVTVTRTVPPASTATDAPGSSEKPTTGEPDPTDENSEPAAGKRRLPNVVGMNHQEAQDRLQAAGFRRLSEEDATGRNRILLWDRNWVVVDQIPKPGSRIPLDTRIILRSKKLTD